MRRQLNAILLACAIVAALPAKGADAQVVPQQESVALRAIDFDWVDSLRERQVPARLYWPVAVSGRVPLIVFSHGMGGSRNGYTYLATRWAARGIASLHVQHIGSDTTLLRGNPLKIVNRLQSATQDSEAAARVGDLRFALDRILSGSTGPYAGLIDHQRIVAAGHSYGANTSLLAIGAQVNRDGRWLEFRDRRYKAAILISAPPFYGETDLAGVLAKITVPTLHVTATQDVIRIPGFYSPAGDRLTLFNAIPNSRKLLAVFRGGSHSMFTDRPLTGGRDLNPMVKEATANLTLAFLDYAFAGDVTGVSQWRDDWRDILNESVVVTSARQELRRTTPARPIATTNRVSIGAAE
jgi:predicted dienelactone hydrolase